jgi:hypothetical protein
MPAGLDQSNAAMDQRPVAARRSVTTVQFSRLIPHPCARHMSPKKFSGRAPGKIRLGRGLHSHHKKFSTPIPVLALLIHVLMRTAASGSRNVAEAERRFNRRRFQSHHLADRQLALPGRERRPHPGSWYSGKTPIQTFLDALPLAKEKLMAA